MPYLNLCNDHFYHQVVLCTFALYVVFYDGGYELAGILVSAVLFQSLLPISPNHTFLSHAL